MSISEPRPGWDSPSEVLLEEPRAGQLSGQVVRGLGWKAVSQIATQGTRLIVGITLARLLTPHQFGVAAMALVVTAFVIPFADIGLGSALVQRATIDELDRSTVFWTSVSAGVLLSVLGAAASPLVADFYGNPSVAPLVAVLSLSFVITSFGATHRSLLARDMNFRSLELRYVVGTVVGGATAIALAVAGYGPWAFVGSQLALATVSTALLWTVLPWRPSLRFSRARLRDLGGFGVRALGGATFTNLSRNADNILIGRYLGAYALGLYAFAYNVMLASLTRLVAPVQQVIFPALSRLQGDRRRLASSWIRASRVVAAASVPVLLIVIITAPDLVPLVFGHRWVKAVPLVQILCWAGAIECLVALNEVVLKAQNAVKLYLNFTACAFAVNLASFVVGLHWGVYGVATAFAIASTALGVIYTALVVRVTELSLGAIAVQFRGVVLAIAGMAGCCLATRELLVGHDVPPLVRIIVTVEIAVAVYLWLLRWLAPGVLEEVRRTIFRKETNAAPRTPADAGAVAPVGRA
jgi:O-antigen/teichoic acid export membrane protein